MKRVVIVKHILSGQEDMYRFLRSACNKLGLSYSTVSKAMSKDGYYNTKDCHIYRKEVM